MAVRAWMKLAFAARERRQQCTIMLGALPALLILLVTVPPVAAGEPRPSQAVCDRAKLPGRSYVECLEQALRGTDRALDAAHARALAAIEARSDLTSAQRTRWKNVLEEAHGLFVRFRNFECQNVAPYEGGSGRIGAFEQRLACLIDKNAARAGELQSRYGD